MFEASSGRRPSASHGPRLLTPWVALCLWWPAEAWALCPNCLGQRRNLTPTLELLGLFLLIPFVIGYLVMRRIRRICREARVSEG